jgi:hypothetical protein
VRRVLRDQNSRAGIKEKKGRVRNYINRQGIIFEWIFLPIVKKNIYINKEAKTSEVGTTENERKYYFLPDLYLIP